MDCKASWIHVLMLHSQKLSYCFQYDSLSASCSWRKWGSMYLQSRVFPASPLLSIGGSVINISVMLSALCRGSVPPRETTRTTTTNNNKLDHYEVCSALSVPTYLLATCFSDIVTKPSSVIAPIYSHDSFYLTRSTFSQWKLLPFYVILWRQNIWSNYSLEKTYGKMLWLNLN